jgi:geranylgeranyl transferase type-2 subunit beta
VSGDHFGESDTRFSYILLNALSLLGRLTDLDRLHDGHGRQLVLDNILGCMNFDGAFGTEPGAESHGGQGKRVASTLISAEGQYGSAPPHWRY